MRQGHDLRFFPGCRCPARGGRHRCVTPCNAAAAPIRRPSPRCYPSPHCRRPLMRCCPRRACYRPGQECYPSSPLPPTALALVLSSSPLPSALINMLSTRLVPTAMDLRVSQSPTAVGHGFRVIHIQCADGPRAHDDPAPHCRQPLASCCPSMLCRRHGRISQSLIVIL